MAVKFFGEVCRGEREKNTQRNLNIKKSPIMFYDNSQSKPDIDFSFQDFFFVCEKKLSSGSANQSK